LSALFYIFDFIAAILSSLLFCTSLPEVKPRVIVVSAFALINHWFPLEGAVASFFVAVAAAACVTFRRSSSLLQIVAE
jgi:hypothetical protein